MTRKPVSQFRAGRIDVAIWRCVRQAEVSYEFTLCRTYPRGPTKVGFCASFRAADAEELKVAIDQAVAAVHEIAEQNQDAIAEPVEAAPPRAKGRRK